MSAALHVRRSARGPLSDRERQILRLTAEGLQGPEIAQRLGLSHWTVQDYDRSIRRKLGTHTKAQAVHVAHVHGLWDDSDSSTRRTE